MIVSPILRSDFSVQSPPEITFNIESRKFQRIKCANDSILIQVTVPATESIINRRLAYNRKTSTESRIYLKTLESNTAKAVLTISTSTGCIVKGSITIQNYPESSLKIEFDESEFSPRDTIINMKKLRLVSLDKKVRSIDLNVKGGTDISWTPVDNTDNPKSEKITIFPSHPLTQVILSGTDNNNCLENDTLVVFLDNLRPQRVFSPNGDGKNDVWQILNISTMDDCEVFIFDSIGQNIQVSNSQTTDNFRKNGDNNVWDRTSDGKEVLEGVYYYVLKVLTIYQCREVY